MKPGVDGLKLHPSYVYASKAAMTRVLSLSWLARTGGEAPEAGLRILFYHRVSDDRDELAVSPKRFGQQMDFLASEGFRVVDVAEAGRLLREPEIPARVVGLSFDDGYRDIADNALPILAAHGFAASVFIVTGTDGSAPRFTWYRRQPPLLSWEDIASLDGDSPFCFEAHTVTHPNLMTLDLERARAEIVESKQVLEERLGRTVNAFSYPGGLYGDREMKLVAEAGYRVAVSCEPGTNTPATNPLELHRRQVDRRDRLIDFRAKALGGHDNPLPIRAQYRRLRHGPEVRGADRKVERIDRG